MNKIITSILVISIFLNIRLAYNINNLNNKVQQISTYNQIMYLKHDYYPSQLDTIHSQVLFFGDYEIKSVRDSIYVDSNLNVLQNKLEIIVIELDSLNKL